MRKVAQDDWGPYFSGAVTGIIGGMFGWLLPWCHNADSIPLIIVAVAAGCAIGYRLRPVVTSAAMLGFFLAWILTVVLWPYLRNGADQEDEWVPVMVLMIEVAFFAPFVLLTSAAICAAISAALYSRRQRLATFFVCVLIVADAVLAITLGAVRYLVSSHTG